MGEYFYQPLDSALTSLIVLRYWPDEWHLVDSLADNLQTVSASPCSAERPSNRDIAGPLNISNRLASISVRRTK